jgi:aerobic-type carbon monoxide dehydrogenase small subunit (CoxS/CutS family)
MKSKITGRVEEWWKSVCQKHNYKYYIHEDYPSCSYCTCPGNCIVVEVVKEHKEESEDKT